MAELGGGFRPVTDSHCGGLASMMDMDVVVVVVVRR